MIEPFIDGARLASLGEAALVCDVRWYLDGRSGREAYLSGHLPGARFVDLDTVLAGEPAPGGGRHPLPTPERFAASLSALGIGEAVVVVGYDDEGGVIAARLVWMLRALGQDAAILDGGLTAYDGPIETGPVVPAPVPRAARPWPEERLASIEEATSPTNIVLDARQTARFTGEEEPLDARAGHIPGARSLPCRGHLDSSGRLAPRAELLRRFASVGVDGERAIVSYCGSGVTACHNLLVLEHAGFPPGRLFPGSWSQYASDLARPVATGPGDGAES